MVVTKETWCASHSIAGASHDLLLQGRILSVSDKQFSSMRLRSSSSSEEHIQVLETLLQRTFAAHPHLKRWAFEENGISSAGRQAMGEYSVSAAEVVQDPQHKIARLKHNRDKWRDRALKLKDMCKQLQLRVQQDTISASKSSDPFLENTANLMPAADIGIGHTSTQPMSRDELQELKDDLLATAPATSRRARVSTASIADTDPIMNMPGLRIRTSTDGKAAHMSSPGNDTGCPDSMKLPAAMATPTVITPGSGKTAYKSALKKCTAGATTSKKGVSLHESQNITHEFEDEVAAAREEQRVPSIMEMLQAGGPPCDAPAVQKPSLMEVLQQQEQEKQKEQQAAQAEKPSAAPSLSKLLPCMLSIRTSLDAAGNTQLSLSIDDATRDVLTGLLKMTSTDELKSTPPLDFFAAAGLLESFTYTPNDPKTPAYFKEKPQCDSDEQSNPFARTGRIAVPQDDDEDEEEDGLQSSNVGHAQDSVAPCEVVGFSCYDSPRVPGSAMDMIQGGLAEADSDLADRIFGSPAAVDEQNSDDEKAGVLDRIFGGAAADSSDEGSEAAKEGVLGRIFGGGSGQEEASDSGSDALIEGLADRIFGGTAGARLTDDADVQSPSVKDRVRSFEEMLGGGASLADAEDDLEANRAMMTSRIFGDAAPVAGGAQARVSGDLDLDQARAGLTMRIFGNEESSEPGPVDGQVLDDMDRLRDALTLRIFGADAASEPAGDAQGSVEAVDDDECARLDLTDRLFGSQEDSAGLVQDGAGAHQTELEQRIFGIHTLAKAVGAKVAGNSGGSTAAAVSKWQQQENTAALHSTRIRAGAWMEGDDGDEDGADLSDQVGHSQVGNAGRLQLPGGHAALDVAPYGF